MSLVAQLEILCRKNSGQTIYLDNLEDPLKDEDFKKWFLSFVRTSNWRILYSSRTHLNSKLIKSISIPKMDKDTAKEMFLYLWEEGMDAEELPVMEEKMSAEELSVMEQLLDEIDYHPLTIHLLTAQRWRWPTVKDLLQNWHERRKEIELDDHEERHNSLTTALYMSYDTIKDSREALVLWGILSFVPGELSQELFDVIFLDNKAIYQSAAETLLKNGLVEWTKDSPPAYAMLAPIKNTVFEYDRSLESECVERLCTTLISVFNAPNQRKQFDYLPIHYLALICLPTALAFLKRTKLDGERNRELILKMRNYYKYSQSTSLDVIKVLMEEEADQLLLAFLNEMRGGLEKLLDEIEYAKGHYEQAEKLYRNEKDNIGLANVLLRMGDLERRLGEIESAKDHYEQAEKLYLSEKNDLGLANVLKSMGDLEMQLGEIESAKGHYEQAEKLYRSEKANLGLANVLVRMGDLEMRLGELESVKCHYEQAEKLYRSEKDNLGLANVLQRMGDLRRKQEDYTLSINYYEKALSLYIKVQEPLGRSYTMGKLCLANAQAKRKEDALQWREKIEDELDQIPEDVRTYVTHCINEAMELLDADDDDGD